MRLIVKELKSLEVIWFVRSQESLFRSSHAQLVNLLHVQELIQLELSEHVDNSDHSLWDIVVELFDDELFVFRGDAIFAELNTCPTLLH